MQLQKGIFLLICGVLLISSCKSDKSYEQSATPVNGTNSTAATLPDVCDMLSESQVKKFLSPNADQIDIINGNRSGLSTSSASCFFKWSDRVYDASGVMIQMQSNPLPEDLPTFVSTYMYNKKYEGENSADVQGVKFKYEDFPGLEVPAIYNAQLNRYYFGYGEKYLCSVAFNYPIQREKLDAAFLEIAKIMLKQIK